VVKRRKRVTPIALLWTRRDQLRFTDAVERLVAQVGDLQLIVRALQAEHAVRPRRRRAAAADGIGELQSDQENA
jgi:hypothetical protein